MTVCYGTCTCNASIRGFALSIGARGETVRDLMYVTTFILEFTLCSTCRSSGTNKKRIEKVT